MKTVKKKKEEDFNLFKKLLNNHSIDNPPSQKKYYTSFVLEQMLDYAKSGYFSHFNLILYSMQNEQREEDYNRTVFIDETVQIPYLSDFEEVKEKKNQLTAEQENKNREPEIDKKAQNEIEKTEKDEEDQHLDPITLQLIKDKIKEAEEKVELQL